MWPFEVEKRGTKMKRYKICGFEFQKKNLWVWYLGLKASNKSSVKSQMEGTTEEHNRKNKNKKPYRLE